MNLNPKLEKFIFQKINEELCEKLLFPFGKELWIIDEETKEWFIQYECNGFLWYNQKKFMDILRIFCLTNSEIKFVIKKWFEKIFEFNLNSLSRKNTNYNYLIEGMLKTPNKEWSIKERYGFNYQTVKKYIEIKKISINQKVKLQDFYFFDFSVSA